MGFLIFSVYVAILNARFTNVNYDDGDTMSIE